MERSSTRDIVFERVCWLSGYGGLSGSLELLQPDS